VTQINHPAEGQPLVYQTSLDLSTRTLALVSTALRQHRTEVRSRWRKLPDTQVAIIVLAALRHDARPADLATAYGVSHHSVRRWITQVVTTLARMAPRLDRVLTNAARTNHHILLLDGTCLRTERPTNRTREHHHWCPTHKTHHLRALTLTDHHGRLLWISPATGARTHETTQAKRLHIPPRLRAHNLTLFCDRGHTRLDDDPTNPTVITGRRAGRNHKLTPAERTANNLVNAERAPNEHAHAHLKNWRILTRLRHGWMTNHATTLLRALLVLTNHQINR
jgi:DDE superfamily endonuclease